MSTITIEVWDATGNKKQLVEVPADAPVNRVIAVLVERMNLPRQSPDGQMMSYKFHHSASRLREPVRSANSPTRRSRSVAVGLGLLSKHPFYGRLQMWVN